MARSRFAPFECERRAARTLGSYYGSICHAPCQLTATPVRRSDPFTCDASTHRLIVRPDRDWECVAGGVIQPRGVNEGPSLLRVAGRFVLFYAGSGANTEYYQLGLAVAERIDGPYVKVDGPGGGLVDLKRYPGTGHCSFVRDPSSAKLHMIAHTKRHASMGWDRSPVLFEIDETALSSLVRSVRPPAKDS